MTQPFPALQLQLIIRSTTPLNRFYCLLPPGVEKSDLKEEFVTLINAVLGTQLTAVEMLTLNQCVFIYMKSSNPYYNF